ncbi:RlpA-like double-psi beta-barrel-protein domain-containing protein-containing protein, partial [Syncephalis plumigaleata]
VSSAANALASMFGQATYYNPSVGTGACGVVHNDNEHVVAIPKSYFKSANPNADPMCNQCVRAKGPNGSLVVRVVDICPECPQFNIDLSPAAFAVLGFLDKGRIDISW